MIEQHLFSHLSTDAGVSALVGSGDQAKVYEFEDVPQGTESPFITWREVSGVPPNSFDGSGSLMNSRLQIDCYADTPLELRTMRTAVRAAMESAKDVTEFSALLISQNGEGREANTLLHRYTMDFSIWYND